MTESRAIQPDRDDLGREHPALEPEDIRHALAFAAQILGDGVQPREAG